jgi:hypothetical protein
MCNKVPQGFITWLHDLQMMPPGVQGSRVRVQIALKCVGSTTQERVARQQMESCRQICAMDLPSLLLLFVF